MAKTNSEQCTWSMKKSNENKNETRQTIIKH
jgi:hypothetical protein